MRLVTRRIHRAHWSADDGVAMLEFVLMLPFIWIVLVLILDFGQAFLERQRTSVGVREIAIRTALGGDPDVERDVFAARGMTATFAVADGGTCPRQPAIDEGQVSDALRTSGGWDVLSNAIAWGLERASRTKVYTATTRGRPVAGALLAAGSYTSCYAIDSGTWTNGEIGGWGNIIVNWLRSLF